VACKASIPELWVAKSLSHREMIDWLGGETKLGFMFEILWMVSIYPMSFFRPRHEPAPEVLALRHQITVLKRQTHRPNLRFWDRFFWIMLRG